MPELVTTREEFYKMNDRLAAERDALVRGKSLEYIKGEDFLAMQRCGAAMCGTSPEEFTFMLACKHIATMRLWLEKGIRAADLEKWHERVNDGVNLLLMCNALVEERVEVRGIGLGTLEAMNNVEAMNNEPTEGCDETAKRYKEALNAAVEATHQVATGNHGVDSLRVATNRSN